MVLGLCGGLCREEVFMMSLKGILKLWEETSKNKDLSHVYIREYARSEERIPE